MNFNSNLKKIQNYIKSKGIDFLFVFSNDEFLRECSNLNFNSRYLLSGFSGSAGDMLVSQDKAYLFVDGRYHIQVDEQTDANFITPIKLQMGERFNDKVFEIISESEIKNPKIAIPSKKISERSFEALNKKLSKLNPEILKMEEDIVCKFFAINGKQKVYKVWNAGIKTVGKSTIEKLKGLRKYENDFLLVFSNDEICYLANIRANQNPYSSSLSSFALVNNSCVYIFCDTANLPTKFKNSCEGVVFKDFSKFKNEILKIKGKIFYEASKTPLFYVDKIKQTGLELRKISQSPIAKMKSVKNKAEMAYIKECYEKSDIAILKSIKFLNEKLSKNLAVSCGEFMDKLIAFQKEQGVIELSFCPILAVNERSAIIHCTEFDRKLLIKEGDLILLDFGVYFEGGYATDMTRTFAAGNKYKNETLKKVYTTVLKAFLNTLNYKITPETTFFDLDKKARDIISKSKLKGFNFNHGTGHGIGLNVHEMPPVLGPSKFAKKKIKAGMVFSIEPGMYKLNEGGVRLENSVCTVKTPKGVAIQTLTNLPFDEKLIIFDMLTKKEQIWLDEYQSRALK